jgi:hypothetical protein
MTDYQKTKSELFQLISELSDVRNTGAADLSKIYVDHVDRLMREIFKWDAEEAEAEEVDGDDQEK